MITHTKKSNGGEIVVSYNKKNASVDFTVSNKQFPVACLTCNTKNGDCKTTLAIVGALVEKYNPVVLLLKTPVKELLYTGNIGTTKRIDTQNENSLYCSSGQHKELAIGLWEISRAMDCGHLIEGCVFSFKKYNKLDVLKEIRESTTPFEFLYMKEEYDFAIKKKCENCFISIRDKTKQYAQQKEKHSNCFVESVSRMEKTYKSHFQLFESNFSCVESCVVNVLLPAIVLLGEENDFVKSLFLTFTKECQEYINTSSEFLENYKSAIKNA